jgi:cysteinyl-tRNA synthetase
MSVDNEKSTTKNLEDDLMQLILSLRSQAKERKDYTSADGIRQALQAIGITIKDTKDGVEWSK